VWLSFGGSRFDRVAASCVRAAAVMAGVGCRQKQGCSAHNHPGRRLDAPQRVALPARTQMNCALPRIGPQLDGRVRFGRTDEERGTECLHGCGWSESSGRLVADGPILDRWLPNGGGGLGLAQQGARTHYLRGNPQEQRGARR